MSTLGASLQSVHLTYILEPEPHTLLKILGGFSFPLSVPLSLTLLSLTGAHALSPVLSELARVGSRICSYWFTVDRLVH